MIAHETCENKPSVMMATQCFPPDVGGIQSLMAHIAHALNQHVALTVLSDQKSMFAPKPAWDQQQSYAIRRIRGPKPWRKRQKARLLQHIASSMYAPVLITDTWKSAEYLLSTAKKIQMPIITLAHGNDILSKNCAKRSARIQNTLQQVQQVVAVSNDTAKRVRALGIKHCRVIYNGVHVVNAQQQPSPNSGPRLLTIARLEPRKGHDQVLKALLTLKKTWPDIHYDIAGTGKDLARLKQLVQQYQLQQHVSFLGSVDDKAKALLLQQTNLFVMPVRHDQDSHSIEGFGMALAEAQMAGCVVLTGQVGGVLDVVQNRITGFCCDGGSSKNVLQAMQYILQNPQHATTCALAGQQHASKHFSVAAMTKQYLTLIHDILQLPCSTTSKQVSGSS